MPLAAGLLHQSPRRLIAVAAGIMRALLSAGAPTLPAPSAAAAAASANKRPLSPPPPPPPPRVPPPHPLFACRAFASAPTAAARAAKDRAATAAAPTAESSSLPAATATAAAPATAPAPPPPPEAQEAWPHVPVLLDEVLAAFAPPFRPRTYVDGTLGAGGHASAMLAAHGPSSLRLLVGVDVDPAAHAVAGPRLDMAAEEAASAAAAAQRAAAAAAAEAGAGAAAGGEGAEAAKPPATVRLLRGNHSDISRLLAEVEWPADVLGPHPGGAGKGGGGGDGNGGGSSGGGKKSTSKKNSLLGGVDAMLLDLGVSSMQIDDAGRGFSFVRDGPLDMRMAREAEEEQQQPQQQPTGGRAGPPAAAGAALVAGGAGSNHTTTIPTTTTTTGGGLTAADIVNTWSEAALAELIRDYGEEKMWRRVAARIVRAREEKGALTTTGQLAAAIGRTALRSTSGGGRRGGSKSDIHPATRTFQALRIAVNDELGGLERAIPAAIAALAPGGRLAVISFHSLEDRVVKHAMLRAAGKSTPEDEAAMAAAGAARGAEGEAWRLGREAAAVGRVLTRRPVLPGEEETARNPRARSAKLRVFEKFGVAGGSDAGGGGVGGGEGADAAAGGGGAAAAAGGKKATHRSKKWRELDEQQTRSEQD